MPKPKAVSPPSKWPGINLSNEGTLHANIKEWYSLPGDRFEEKVDGYIVDLVREGPGNELLLIEIQTGNFPAIRRKLQVLLQSRKVRVVYPVAQEKFIVKLDGSGRAASIRKSPKTGHVLELFNELVRMPDIINHENFSLEVLMVKVEETRCADGKGSWRRRGVSIKDRRLLEVFERHQFNTSADFITFLPGNLPCPFSNKNLAHSMGQSIHMARKVSYCLKKMGLIRQVGKKGNEMLFEINGVVEESNHSGQAWKPKRISKKHE